MFYHRCDACFCSGQHIFTTQPKTVVSNGLLWVLSTHTAIFIIVSRRVFIFHIILREGERTSMLYVLSLSLSPSLSLALSRSLSLSLKRGGKRELLCSSFQSITSHQTSPALILGGPEGFCCLEEEGRGRGGTRVWKWDYPTRKQHLSWNRFITIHLLVFRLVWRMILRAGDYPVRSRIRDVGAQR